MRKYSFIMLVDYKKLKIKVADMEEETKQFLKEKEQFLNEKQIIIG